MVLSQLARNAPLLPLWVGPQPVKFCQPFASFNLSLPSVGELLYSPTVWSRDFFFALSACLGLQNHLKCILIMSTTLVRVTPQLSQIITKMWRPVLHRWAHGDRLLSGGLRHHHDLLQSHGNVKGRQVAVSVNGRRRGQWAQAHGCRKDAGGSRVRSAPVCGACSRWGEPFAIWFHAAVNYRATGPPFLSVLSFYQKHYF